MRRGQIIIIAARGDFTSKPRPHVIVQNDGLIAESTTVTACPLTTRLLGTDLIRVRIDPDDDNGLARPSEIQVHLVTSVRKSRVDQIVGMAGSDVMIRVDQALQRWLAR